MRKIKDLKGKLFGRLTVIEFSHKSEKEKGAAYWKCSCECGGSTISRGGCLISGQTKSCGCLRKEAASKFIIKQNKERSLPEGEASKNMMYKFYEKRAASRELSFELSKEQFVELTSKNCYYCDKEPSQVIHCHKTNLNGAYVYNGIDRKDNSLGYIIGNCVPCCKDCNIAKMQMSETEFLKLIKRIYEYRKLSMLDVPGTVPGDPA